MSRGHGSNDDSAATYPVLSDRPIEVHNPQRKMRIIAVTYSVAILVTAVVGAYVASSVAIDQNDSSRRQLEREIEQRTKQRSAEAERFARALEQYRHDQCEITGRLEQTPEIVEIRARYRCANPVTPPPRPAATSSPAAFGDQGPAASSRSGSTGGASTSTPRAQPAPAPAAPAPRAPTPPPEPAPGIPPVPTPPQPPWLCLPLIGCIL